MIAFLMFSSAAYAQISENLFRHLPDSTQPRYRLRVRLQETGRILRAYYSIPDPMLRNELAGLAKLKGARYRNLADVNERMLFLNDLSWFWYQRNIPDSVDKYSKIALQEASRFTGIDRRKEAYARKIQAYVKIDKDNFSGAYADFQSAIDIFKTASEFEQISDCHSGVLMIFQKLQLYDRVISSADSTFTFVTKHSNYNAQEHLKPYLLLIKARAHISKFSEHLASHSADSASFILRKVLQFKEPSQFRWRIEAYTELARLAYHQKKYKHSIMFADSAFILKGPNILENTNEEVRLVYKGLSLLETGKINEGVSLLKSINRKKDAEYNGVLLKRLVEYEAEHENYDMALHYHMELLDHFRRSQILGHRGDVFELERKYNMLVKDLEISRLRKKERGLLRITFGVLALLSVLGLFFWNRYRVARNKTRSLIGQLAELTDIQMIRVEDAENRIRKKIAQDLHDDFSSSIAASTQFLQAQTLKETDTEAKRKMNLIVGILQDSYRKARTMSHQIYYDEGETKFWEGLVDHITLFFSGSKIELSVDVEPNGLILPLEIKITVLLTVKEAIVNIIKHAQATHVEILVFTDPDWLNLEITDNGRGMFMPQRKGIGLDSINKRVRAINGDFSITNPSRGGTTLKVRIPVDTTL
ncbi:ATP-binding protein [Dyadobacter sp. LHD-138]|uniref:sensor histidine kinase n=1 Tax=Dyadobacter sp. LHD-138 TaxID=3071413 RepID=UPI0027E1306D|nr:ATP-binding protein [Dyadobacter sp. LHD-138]MDQ6480541.1 ATP-binding protein [Dyadobacter sp. LHD-138]